LGENVARAKDPLVKKKQTHDIFVVGASMGGVSALQRLVGGLPHDFPGSLFVVLHMAANQKSFLPDILTRSGPLLAIGAIDGTPIRPGQIYVCVPDYHLILGKGHIHLSHDARDNGHRPSVDSLFRSAAYNYSSRVVGIVLTGALDCGTEGLRIIKEYGGKAIVQDPKEAHTPDMPTSALESVSVDYCVRISEMARVMTSLTKQSVGPSSKKDMRTTIPSGYVCPECTGPMWELRTEGLPRLQCRVGHSYSLRTFYEDKSRRAESTLWQAYETLLEQAKLARRISDRANALGNKAEAAHYLNEFNHCESSAEALQNVLLTKTIAKSTSQDRPHLRLAKEIE
jgi:two-component system, chemotaxis family, protein-glutamate methylesterase/glutaminase